MLSFDSASIPDIATITSATLTVRYRSAAGNPWGNPACNTLVVEADTGCIGACTVATTDRAAAVGAPAVASIPAFTGGSQASTLFSAAGLVAIHRSGRTLLRLRFASNQTATNYVWIDRGATATLSVTSVP